ncbi:MAG: arginase family protein [Bacteriovoracaceae bacterium]
MNSFSHLNSRAQKKLKSKFINGEAIVSKPAKAILTSSNDLGVALNGGRIGSLYGPKAIMNQLGNLIAPKDIEKVHVFESINSDKNYSYEEFNQMQEDQIDFYNDLFKRLEFPEKLIHLGSGHDQIYPLLSSIGHIQKPKWKRVVLINLDAHLDTRTDSHFHSGTPFRQWFHERKKSQAVKIPTIFYQVGINSYANDSSNYENYPNQDENFESKILPINEIDPNNYQSEKNTVLHNLLNSLNKDDLLYISLDCDALCSYQFQAVSAPNHEGLTLEWLSELLEAANNKSLANQIFGLYEYNPKYDDLSCHNARNLTPLILKML